MARKLIAAGLAAATLIAAGAGAEPARAADDATYVKQLRERFSPRHASDEHLAILLAGPGGDTWRGLVESAQVGETLVSSESRMAATMLALYGVLSREASKLLLAEGTSWLTQGREVLGAWALLPSVLNRAYGAFRTITRADQEEIELLQRISTVFTKQEFRGLLQQYVGDREMGASQEDAWANIAELAEGTNLVEQISDGLGIDPDAYPDKLEFHYQLIRIGRDGELIAALGDALDAAAAAIDAYRKPAGPIRTLIQGSDLQLVNTGPDGARLTFLTDGGEETGSRYVGPDSTGLLAPQGGWAAASTVRVEVDDLGTFVVPASNFNATIWTDPIRSELVGGTTLRLSVDRALSANDGVAHPASFTWRFGDGTPDRQAGSAVTHDFRCPGTYAVQADVAMGPFTTSTKLSLPVADPWGLTLQTSQDGIVLAGSPLRVSPGGQIPATGVTYHWSFGDGATATTREAEHRYASDGSYVIRLVATETATGCARIVERRVTVGSSYTQLPSRIHGRYELEPHHVYAVGFSGTEIAANATLVAREGTVIKARSQTGLSVLQGGRMELHGSSSDPVVLTSFDDDSAGGDTNGNGASSPTAFWNGIHVGPDNSATLAGRHVEIRRAQRVSNGSTITTYGPVTLTDAKVLDGGGIVVPAGSIGTVDALRTTIRPISPSGTAAEFHRGSSLRETTLLGGGTIRLESGHTLIDGLDAPASPIPVAMHPNASSSTLRRISAAPGARLHVNGGDFYGFKALSNTDLPYLLRLGVWREVRGHLQIRPGVRLELDTDATIGVAAGGILELAGQPGRAVSLTRGGTGLWRGINVSAGGSLRAASAEIADAAGVNGTSAAVNVQGGAELVDVGIRRGGGLLGGSTGSVTSTRLTVETAAGRDPVALATSGNTLRDTTVLGTGTRAVSLAGGPSTVEGLAAGGHAVPVAMTPASAGSALRDVAGAPGARLEISFGDFTGTSVLTSTDLPYRITQGGTSVGHTRTIRGRLEVPAGASVAVESPSVLRVAAGGQLVLRGEPGRPARLERTGTTDWGGLTVQSGGTLESSRAWISGTQRLTFDAGSTAAVQLSRILSPVTAAAGLDLSRNWWGSATGPGPAGAGSALSGAATASPWCRDPDCTDLDPLAIVSLETAPDSVELLTGGTIRLEATAIRRDASRTSVTGTAVWASADPQTATVDEAGLVTGVAPGTTSVRATYEGASATTAVTVRDPDVAAPAIDLQRPVDGERIARGAVVDAAFACEDEPDGSGVRSCTGTVPAGGPLDTSSLGRRTFEVIAVDRAGNRTVRTAQYEIVDLTAPSATIAAPTAAGVYPQHQVVTASYSCSDEEGGSGVSSCVGSVPSGERVDTAVLGGHTFEVVATDGAGNSATQTVAYTVVDVTAPETVVETPVEGATYPQHQQVAAAYRCADEPGGSGIDACVAQAERVDTSTLGRHSFTVAARDRAGNTAARTVAYTVVDVTAPAIAVAQPAGDAAFDQHEDVRAEYSCADEAGGSGLASCDGTVASGDRLDTSTAGAHELTVTAADLAGNRATTTVAYTARDRLAPDIAITRPAGSYRLGQQVTASYRCTDNAGGTGVASCEGSVPDGQPIPTGSPGRRTFTVTAVDRAGNRRSQTVTYDVVLLGCSPLVGCL